MHFECKCYHIQGVIELLKKEKAGLVPKQTLTRHANSGKLPLGIDKTLAALLRQEEKIIRILLNDDSGTDDK